MIFYLTLAVESLMKKGNKQQNSENTAKHSIIITFAYVSAIYFWIKEKSYLARKEFI
jgi:hypothetical protein